MITQATLAVLVSALLPWAPSPAQSSNPPSDLVVSMEWLQARLGDPSVAVIATGGDATSDANGRIPGARFLSHEATLGEGHRLLPPHEMAKRLAQAGASDSGRVVIYGDDPLTTGWLFMVFDALGHGDKVSMLDGNLAAWRSGGRPVSREAVPPATSTLTPRPSPNVVVDADWVKSHVDDPRVRVLDVRSERERANGYIADAPLVLWRDLYADFDSRRFKNPAEMEQVFERAGVKRGQTVVTYCAIGMRASLMYMAARRLGIPARVYVGSWADWSARRYPVAGR